MNKPKIKLRKFHSQQHQKENKCLGTNLTEEVQILYLKTVKHGGFPGGAVVENLPANAGNMGSSPGLGRSHMPRSNWAREPQLLSLRVWSLCSATKRGCDSEKPAHHNEEWPPLATTRESPRTETKTQHSQKKKKNVVI